MNKKKNLNTFENIINYKFKNPVYLTSALAHPSSDRSNKEFERLEFLGDRVLGVVIAAWIYETFPKDKEGDLAQRMTTLVRKEACADVAAKLNLEQHLRYGKQEIIRKSSIFADAVEAILGAIFLDSGLEACERFVKHFWDDLFTACRIPSKDAKSELQEHLQGLGQEAPLYLVDAIEGPDHNPTFRVRLAISSYPEIIATGNSKKRAEHEAAAEFLRRFVKL